MAPLELGCGALTGVGVSHGVEAVAGAAPLRLGAEQPLARSTRGNTRIATAKAVISTNPDLCIGPSLRDLAHVVHFPQEAICHTTSARCKHLSAMLRHENRYYVCIAWPGSRGSRSHTSTTILAGIGAPAPRKARQHYPCHEG